MDLGATVGDVGAGGGGALGERAVVFDDAAPPVDGVDVVVAQREEGQHRHEAGAGVHGRRKDVGVAAPPLLVALEGPVVDEEADDEPGVVVDGFRRRHHAAGAEDDREVDERDPLLVGEEAVEEVDGDRGEKADEEEEVERAVVAPGPEHASGADDAPDDGCGEEDIVAGASPG